MLGESSNTDAPLPLSIILHMIPIKLSYTNYLLWQKQMLPLLAYQQLTGYVDGSIPKPSATITTGDASLLNPAYVSWIAADQRALILIQSSLFEEVMAETLGHSTSHDVWSSLADIYQHDSLEHIHTLRDSLRPLKKGTSTISEFSNKFKTICDQLQAISQPLPDDDKSHWFLCGLGSSFETFSTTQRLITPCPKFHDLVSQAKSHEMFLQSISDSFVAPVAFNTTHRSSIDSSRGRGSIRDRSLYHGSFNRGRGRGTRRPPHCQLCRTKGHYANEFPDLATYARAHMTPSLTNLDAVSSYAGNDSVIFGNGNGASISHIGRLHLSPNISLLGVLVVPKLTKSLFSVSKLTQDNPVDVVFSDPMFLIQNRHSKETLAKGRRRNGLYVLDQGNQAFLAKLSSTRITASFDLWHNRLGHGPSPVMSIDGFRHYVIFIDDYSRRAEHKHRHIVETGLAIMFNAYVPAIFWSHAFSSAAYIINRLPTKLLDNKSPYDLLFSMPPNYGNFHVIVCHVFPYLRDYSYHKLAPRSSPCVFLGYNTQYKGHSSTNSTGMLLLSTCDDYPVPVSSPELVSLPVSHPAPTPPCELCTEPPSLVPLVATSTQPPVVTSTQPDQPTPSPPVASQGSGHPMVTRSNNGIVKTRHFADLSHVSKSSLHHSLFASKEPKGFKFAAKDPKWFVAMCDEMKALKLNATWDLVPRPTKSNIVGSKWVFCTKFLADGTIDKFKARLVAQGFTQVLGIDYSATFSPVVKASTVRIILSLLVLNRWPLHQLDVKNAFLHGELFDIVYMEQPSGSMDSHFPNYVCRLKKALYGLKQAPRCQYSLSLDLGKLNYFLGLEVSYHDSGLFLSQSKYAYDILARSHLLDVKPATMPLSTSAYFMSQGTSFHDPTLYRSLVGALQYLTITRPDLSYAVNQVSQFLHASMQDHFQAVKQIMRYVKGTLSYGLSFSHATAPIVLGYSDADWP
ncbi:retrovirus-related pol polyprotein from transposon RE1 [Tanacetum coccineum]|uniref:Retrovirus-related pol polyprotein from transposon RE1 n=1 Tax=Tanacetum coccineum TaxID=301880 RepID=A0ABQ5B2N6_9ASTR